MRKLVMSGLMAISTVAAIHSAANAEIIEVNAIQNGWYTSTGMENSCCSNIIVGHSGLGTEYRNWLAFDLSGIDGQIIGATITFLENGDYTSVDASEIYQLNSYEGDIDELRTGEGSFEDLGDGNVYGSYEYSGVPGLRLDMVEFTMNLTDLAIEDMNEAILNGDLLAMGGQIASLDESDDDYEYMFSFSWRTPAAYLSLELADTDIPEPAALGLLGLGLAGLGIARRRRS